MIYLSRLDHSSSVVYRFFENRPGPCRKTKSFPGPSAWKSSSVCLNWTYRPTQQRESSRIYISCRETANNITLSISGAAPRLPSRHWIHGHAGCCRLFPLHLSRAGLGEADYRCSGRNPTPVSPTVVAGSASTGFSVMHMMIIVNRQIVTARVIVTASH